MIQAVNNKHVATEAPEGVNVQGEATEEGGEAFAAALMASLNAGEIPTDVKPVEVSPELLLEKPSTLINVPQNGQPETSSPKVFDPALTQDVDQLIGPKTTNTQINPELFKTGRAPSIDFAQAEVDPQMMSMEDFVAQKNIVNKKALPGQGYGMVKPQQQKLMMENGLKSTQVIKDTNSLEATSAQPMNSQQFILNMMNEQKGPHKIEIQAPVKTFDMSQIKTSNPNQIMTQITDYIVQAKAAKEPTVNMRVNHEDLGMIDITVQRTSAAQDAVAINIGTHSTDGKNFFQQNSKELFSHLTQAGINVSDMKVETPSQSARNDFDMSNQSGRQGFERQFGSEQNQRRHESDRRQDLWNLLKDKEAA